MTSKKRQSFYEFITPNRQMSYSEYVKAIHEGNIITVNGHKRTKPGGRLKTVNVRRHEKRKQIH